jgi:CheY-like chemotaxis protein
MRRKGFRVLIVEDDTGARWALAELLRSEGFVVTEAVDGVEALELLGDAAPDVIVSDVELPRLGGMELYERVQRLPDGPPMLLMGARCPPSYPGTFIGKPIVFETFVDALESTLAGRGARPTI